MARKKSDLPTKVCPACGRTFAWRARWRSNWDAVVYCGERCRRSGRKAAGRDPRDGPPG